MAQADKPFPFVSPIASPVQSYLGSSLQVADILEFILRCVGPSEVWQSTFSVSEEFLRRLHVIRKRGLITQAHVLLDHKACRKIIKLWPFISQVYEHPYMADNHSKILLIRSRSGHRISVVTSQNLTRGNRTESTLLLSLPDTFGSLLSRFRDITTFHAIPLNDLFRLRPRPD